MSLSFIDGRYVRNLTEDTSQGGAKYENGDYTRAVVVGNNVQSGVTQNGALDGVPIEFVLERINSQNIPVINVLDSYTAARAIASLRARGTDAHLWLPGGDVRTYGPELVVNGGPFTATTSWVARANCTISATGNNLVGTSTNTSAMRFYLPVATVVGKDYTVVLSISGVTGTGPSCYVYSDVGVTNIVTVATSANGPYSFTFRATTTTSNIEFGNAANTGAGQSYSVASISVREITSITPTITSGLTTGNYLESTGNTLATVDNPTGLVLDALGSVGADLVVSPLSGTASGSWAITASGVTRNGSSSGQASVGIVGSAALETSKRYRVTFTVSDFSGDSFGFRAGGGTALGPIAANGTYTSNMAGGGASGFILIPWNGLAGQATITNISVREVSGIHLTQSTTANKPVLRRGLTNLLTYSSDLSNAAWTVVDSATKTATTCTFAAKATSTVNNLCVVSGGTASKTFTAAVKVSCASGTVPFRIKNTHSAVLDNFSGEMLATTTPTIFVFTVTNSGSAGNGVQTIGLINSAVTPVVNTLTVDGVSLFQGTYTAAQILAAGGIPVTTTAAASNPDAGKYSWSFDGSNDSLALGSVPFQMGDDFAVVCSAKSGTLVVWSSIFSLSGAGTTPRIQLLLENATGHVLGYFRDDASNSLQLNGVADLRNIAIVVSLLKRGTDVYLRVNGQQVSSGSVSTLGATTFTGAGVGYLFSGSDHWLGTIYYCNPIKGAVSDAEILLIEKLAASAAGITI